jgi:hypothetical protein
MLAFDRIFDQHSEDEILKYVVNVLRFFSESASIGQLIETARVQLIHRISTQFRQSVDQACAELTAVDEEDEAAVLAGSRKLAALLM